jgi:hypothetical protein
MNLKVVARFSATSAHNHGYRPMFKPLRYPKTKNSLRTSQDHNGSKISYSVSNISYQPLRISHPPLLAYRMPESIQISNSPAALSSSRLALSTGANALE